MACIIAIDGPGGSGKSTVASRLASRLGLAHLDTGAMYRALTFAVLRDGIDPTDGARVAELARRVEIDLGDPTSGAGAVTVDGLDASAAIRGPEVTGAVSVVSAHPEVRQEMVRRQRQWVSQRGGAVVEGRDIGSVVFPHATLKVFLTASEEERARRRSVQQATGRDPDQVARELARRDWLDSNRMVGPLSVAEGALVIDTTSLGVEEIVDDLVARL